MTTHILSFERRHSPGMYLRACNDAPDTSGQNEAALMTAQLSKEQLDWVKGVYADQAPARAAAEARANEVSDAQLAQSKQQTAIAAQGQADYQTTFRPVEQKLAADAQAYDSPQRREAAAAAAAGGVEQQISAQREAGARSMARMGVDPSSGKALAAMAGGDIAAAAAKAGAATAAERNVETVGAAKMADVANLGRNIASGQATNAQIALSGGTAAAGTSAAALAAANSGVGQVQQGFTTAIQGEGQVGNIYGNIASTQAQNSGNLAAGLGSAAQVAAIIY